MGEISDMMLDGTLCEVCGEFIDEDGGFPRLCASCSREADKSENKKDVFPKRKPGKKKK
jgi:hypothetical protein